MIRAKTDADIRRLANRLSDYLYKVTSVLRAIEEGGHPRAAEIVTALQENNVGCWCSPSAVVDEFVGDE